MALTPQVAMNCVYGFLDREGTESRMRVHMTNPLFALSNFAGFVEYLTYAKVDLANAVAALSDSTPNYIGITQREVENNPGQFGSGEAERKGVFLFLDQHGAPLFRMAVPGIRDLYLQGNSRDINLQNADVAAFITAMTTGTVEHPVSANNFQIVAVRGDGAYKQHRRSHGGFGRRTG